MPVGNHVCCPAITVFFKFLHSDSALSGPSLSTATCPVPAPSSTPRRPISTHALQSSSRPSSSTSARAYEPARTVSYAHCSAYVHYPALVLRPDDIWPAVLVQFIRFVSANAEQLRSVFVVHEGKRCPSLWTSRSTPQTLVAPVRVHDASDQVCSLSCRDRKIPPPRASRREER